MCDTFSLKEDSSRNVSLHQIKTLKGIRPVNCVNLRKIPKEMLGINQINISSRWGTPKAQKVRTLNEAGLYKLIMRSDKPEAQAFQNWIASEVLPSIRKTGMYITPEVIQEATEDHSFCCLFYLCI